MRSVGAEGIVASVTGEVAWRWRGKYAGGWRTALGRDEKLNHQHLSLLRARRELALWCWTDFFLRVFPEFSIQQSDDVSRIEGNLLLHAKGTTTETEYLGDLFWLISCIAAPMAQRKTQSREKETAPGWARVPVGSHLEASPLRGGRITKFSRVDLSSNRTGN